jgi:hypothetical protein
MWAAAHTADFPRQAYFHVVILGSRILPLPITRELFISSFSETGPLGSANKMLPDGTIVAESSAKNLGGVGMFYPLSILIKINHR